MEEIRPEIRQLLRRVAEAMGVSLSARGPGGEVLLEAGTPGDPADALDLPLWVRGRGRGTLLGWGERSRLELMRDLLAHCAEQAERLREASRELLERYEEINLLEDLSQRLSGLLEVEEAAQELLDKALEASGARRGSVMLLNERDELEVVAARGLEGNWRSFRQPKDQGVSGWVVTRGVPLLVRQGEGLPPGVRRSPGRYQRDSFVAVPLLSLPLRSGKRVLGALNLTEREEGPFTTRELKLIAALAAQGALALDRARAMAEARRAEAMRREMEIAAQIQQSLLPRRLPEVEGVELASLCLPSQQVGGDCYDLFLKGGELVGMIADVSGHNLGSALLMAMAKSVLRASLSQTPHPAEALEVANRLCLEELEASGQFITCACFRYHPRSRRLRYASAGHVPALLWGPPHRSLEASGLPLGIVPELELAEEELVLRPGQLLLLCTDGLTELRRGEGMLGTEGVWEMLRRWAPRGARRLIGALRAELDGHRLRDDLTAVAIKVRG